MARPSPKERPIYSRIDKIEAWICEWIASLIELDVSQIDIHKPIAYYGVDSVEAAQLSAAFERWLGWPIPPKLVQESISARQIAIRLTDREV